MPTKPFKKLFTTILVLVGIMVILTTGNAFAGDLKLKTAEGEITTITNGVILLNGRKMFYPAMEIKIPEWTVAGAKVKLAYTFENKKNSYYEIVQQGEKFEVKEELEKLHEELY